MANEKTEIEKLDLNSMNIAEEKQNELLRLFPEIRTEVGKIDFEKLKLALGQMIDTGKERYSVTWPGKAECFKTIQTSSQATLLPSSQESLNFDSTDNFIVEGDNLEVLKLLQKAYLGKIRVIYIDPPYNTGSDLVYPDNYSESLQTYLTYTSQIDSEGKKFGTNTETDGRYHSRWMSMIFPRLYLARNLLSEDGFIFISIDDHEFTNLRKICDEIFGEENYKGTIVRTTGQTTGQDSGGLGSSFDYVLVYSKSMETEIGGLPLDDDDLELYKEEDERGKYALWQLRKTGSTDRRTDRPNMYYAIKSPDGGDVYPIGPTGYESRWRFDKKGSDKLVKDNAIVWKKRKKDSGEEWWPYVKTYLEGRTKRPSPLWDDIEGSKKASIDLKAILGVGVFSNPKPIGLIKRILQIVPDSSEAIVLDFFAGSGTTAQAVLELNKEDGGKRKFILVQLPEKLDPQDKSQQAAIDFCQAIKKPLNISEITKERVRRLINNLKAEQLELNESSLDLGFKLFKLAESNFKTWGQDTSKESLVKQLELHVDHVKHERTPDDILYEILLKSGFPLTTKVETQKFGKQAVYSIAGGMLLVCLEDNLTLELIKHIAEQKPERVVCLDQGFANNDQLKANAVQIFRTKGIASFKTV